MLLFFAAPAFASTSTAYLNQTHFCASHLLSQDSVEVLMRLLKIAVSGKTQTESNAIFDRMMKSSTPINPFSLSNSRTDRQFGLALQKQLDLLSSDDWTKAKKLMVDLNQDNESQKKDEDTQRQLTQALFSPSIMAEGEIETSNTFASQQVRVGQRRFMVTESQSRYYISEFDSKQNRFIPFAEKWSFGDSPSRPLAVSSTLDGRITIAANLKNTTLQAIEFDIRTKVFSEPIERKLSWNIHTPLMLKVGNGKTLIAQLTPYSFEILEPDFDNKTFRVHDSSPVDKLFGFHGLLSHQLSDVRSYQREPAILKWFGDYYVAIERSKDIGLYRISGGTGNLAYLGHVRVNEKSFTAPNLYIEDGQLHIMASTPNFEIFRFEEWFENKGRFRMMARFDSKDRMSGNKQLIFDKAGMLEAVGYLRNEIPCVWFIKEDKEICPKSTSGKSHMKRNPTFFRYTDERLIMVDAFYDEARFYSITPDGFEYLASIPKSFYFNELIYDDEGVPYLLANAYRDHFIVELFRNTKQRGQK